MIKRSLFLKNKTTIHGTGTSTDPYRIYSPAQLNLIASYITAGNVNYVNKHYIQMENLDLGIYDNFDMIGDAIHFLTGVYDGNGKVIYNLNMNHVTYTGLFCRCSGTIKNLGIESGTIIGHPLAGGICGYLDGGVIINCYNKASISVGQNDDASDTNIGGICGESNGYINNCINFGHIYQNSISTGVNQRGAGIVGVFYNILKVTDCINFGVVDSNASQTIMSIAGSGTVYNCYYDSNVCTITGNTGSIGVATENCKGSDVLTNISKLPYLDSEWTANGSDYPILKVFLPNHLSVYTYEDGTENFPYLIYTAKQISDLSTNVNSNVGSYSSAYYKMMNNIDLSEYSNWTPIGTDSHKFLGTFDGNGFFIKNLKITSGILIGFFGASSGVIKNLSIKSGSVSTNNTTDTVCCGSILGRSYGGSILNCYNGSSVTCNSGGTLNTYVGGIVGFVGVTGVIISDCHNAGNILQNTTSSGELQRGCGIAAYTSSTTITRCLNTGNITRSASQTLATITVLSNTNSYYDTTVSSATDSYATGRSTTHCRGTDSLTNSGKLINLGSNWVQQGNNYPIPIKPMLSFGTENYPYLIYTASQLVRVSLYINSGKINSTTSYYKLMNDIDLKDYNWIPIGSINSQFNGNFNGNGKVIYNLNINYDTPMFSLGLFGVGGNDCHIYDLGIEIGNIIYTNENASYIGGIIGGTAGKIERCYNKANISGNGAVGGITGLFGYLSGTYIKNCYNMGNISGAVGNLVGGIVGYSETDAIIDSCYNTGLISVVAGTDSYNSAVIGSDEPSTKCYYDSDTSGTLNNLNGSELELTTLQMTSTAAETNMSLLDFDTIWEISATYPKLKKPV